MALILRALFIKDLRGNRVFPRLAYAVLGHTIDRKARSTYRVLIRRPLNRVSEFVATWRDHEKTVEIFLAAFALLVAFIRALALFAVAIGAAYLMFVRF